jgi:hypothetical protein
MSEQRPNKEFGRRKPVATPAAAPAKRSGHVGLLVMGTLAVGGGAYALMPSQNCQPVPPRMAAPTVPQNSTGCVPRGSSGGGYGASSRFSFFGGDNSSSRSSSASTADASSGGVTRGGFGSFARAFGFSGRS